MQLQLPLCTQNLQGAETVSINLALSKHMLLLIQNLLLPRHLCAHVTSAALINMWKITRTVLLLQV